MRVLFFVFLTTGLLWTQEPDWVIHYGKSAKYPPNLFLTGFASAPAKEKDAEQIASENARANLARNLVVHIKSTVIDKLTESGNRNIQSYQSVTESTTELKLMGVSTEIYKKDKLIYALAVIRRSELARIYTSRKTELENQIRQWLTKAEAESKAGRTAEAADLYRKTFPLYDNLYQAECILMVADPILNANTLRSNDWLSKDEVSMRADRLLATDVRSLEDAARALAYQFSRQVSGNQQSVMVVPFSYQNTQMSSSFARYFQTALESPMLQYTNLRIAHQPAQVSPKSISITRDLAVQSGALYILEGNYWSAGKNIRIIGRLKAVNTGQIIASAETEVDTSLIVERNLQYKPENFLKLLADQKTFAEDEIISGQIQLEAWTNKGNENLVFAEGEVMKVFVRVNRPAHIRILYTMADGQRVLLLNDYYIDESKANFVVEIPQEFECAPPFGSEMMWIIARTEPFPPVKTFSKDGYEYIVDKDTRQMAAGVRGMKIKKSNAPAEQTEMRIILTTVPQFMDQQK